MEDRAWVGDRARRARDGPAPWEDTITPHTRPPADEDAEHTLVRTVACIDGSVEVELVCEPGFDYGRRPGEWSLSKDRHRADATGAGQTIRLQTDMLIGIEAHHARARHVLHEGEELYCGLSMGRGSARAGRRRGDQRAARGDDELLAQLARAGADPRSPAAPVDPALGAGDQGADVHADRGDGRGADDIAARDAWRGAQLGLPLHLDSSTFTPQALHFLDLDWEANEFMQFIADLELGGDGALQIMSGIDGRRDLTETFIEELSGYAGAHPVRICNGAFDQRQNDVFGAALDSVLLHTRRSERLPRRLWPPIKAQAECAKAVWRNPDRGIWEARGKPQHYVSSRLMCWVALDRASKLAEIRGEQDLATSWGETAAEIKADILEHGVDKRGVLRQHYATDALDASTLLAAIFGFLPGTDERLRASVLAIADGLTEHDFVLRYRTDETDDGMSGQEGTFVICSFWLVSALAIIGEMQRARDLIERLVKVASPLGLYAEEFDVDTGRHLGNFPQAFSHLAAVEAAARIVLAERLAEVTG